MEITNAYRHTRRNTGILCGIGLAWSTAQFELKSLSFGPIDSVDLSSASIPLLLACGILYTMTRCTIEFAMQPVDVRRWKLAQTDFKITVYLVRFVLLFLAAGGLYRSVKMIVYLAIATLLLLVVSAFMFFVGMIILTPLRMTIRNWLGRPSAASAVAEAEGGSILITTVLLFTIIIALGAASIQYEPIRSLWIVVPSPLAIAIFIITATIMVASIGFENTLCKKLFAYERPPSPYDTALTLMPNGVIGVRFRGGDDEESSDSEECFDNKLKPLKGWEKRQLKKSIRKYKKAQAYINRGVSFAEKSNKKGGNKGLLKKSISKFRKAIEIKQDSYEAYYNWGVALFEMFGLNSVDERLLKESISKFEKVIEIKVDDWDEHNKKKFVLDAYNNWSLTLVRMSKLKGGVKGLLEEAEEKLLSAEKIKQGSGAYNLAYVRCLLGDEEGCKKWLKVVEEEGKLPTIDLAMNDYDFGTVKDKAWFQELKWGMSK